MLAHHEVEQARAGTQQLEALHPHTGGLLDVIGPQPEHLGALSVPLTGNPFAFRVVIADAKMFLKVFLCVRQIILRLCRDHTPDTIRT